MKETSKDAITILASDQNAAIPTIRVRLTHAGMMDTDTEDKDSDAYQHDELLRRYMNTQLDDLTFRGIEGIDRAFIDKKQRSKQMPDGSISMKGDNPEFEEHVLETSGSSFKAVLAIPGVDPTRTYTNKFTEVFDVLGVEACRAAIYRELKNVLSFDGSYVNFRHMGILCDVMTNRGYVSPVTRHGINQSDTGALMRCSFEQTVEILLEAAAAGELDDCQGVSENLILGQQAPVGTGVMDILLDQAMLDQVIDNSALGLGGSLGVKTNQQLLDGGATPYDSASPLHDNQTLGSPDYNSAFSPIAQQSDAPGGFTDGHSTGFGSGLGSFSPFGQSPASPGFGASSPSWSPSGAGGYSPSSPSFGGATSPAMFGASSPAFSPSSPAGMYSPTSPMMMSPSSPMNISSPSFSPTSPTYSPNITSPVYSPTSPAHYSPTSPTFSPTSPSFSPTSPNNAYSPASPIFRASPTSPSWSPTSPRNQSPASPMYSPTSPVFQSPRSPSSPTAGSSYSPTSPSEPNDYSPSSPKDDDK